MEAGDLRAAEQWFQQIVAADPRAHPAWNALSVVAVRSGLPDVAAEHAQRALALDRRNPLYLNSLGVALGELGRFEEAEQAFRRALKAQPVYPEGLFNLGKVLHKRGDLDGALQAYRRASAMDAGFPGLAIAFASLQRKRGDSAAARDVLRALRTPGEAEAIVLAECAFDLEGPAQAEALLRAAVSERPDWALARMALATFLLGAARWAEGWALYYQRPLTGRAAQAGAPAFARELRGRRILLRAEQGIGDVLFFLRFAPQLAARGANLALACNAKLASIIESGGVLTEVKAPADTAQTADYDEEVLVGDLPARLGAGEPPPAWPLSPNAGLAEAWRARLAALGPPPYLAVTWRAGTDILHRREFGNERNVLMKELPAAELGAALRGWTGTLLALQRKPDAAELAAFAAAAGAKAHDLGALGDDLPALVAVLSLVDEYATVSNTNVHLLAGLGRTARVLIPYPPEWRWMRLDEPSPWFPGFTTYREPRQRGWKEPLLDLRKDLSL